MPGEQDELVAVLASGCNAPAGATPRRYRPGRGRAHPPGACQCSTGCRPAGPSCQAGARARHSPRPTGLRAAPQGDMTLRSAASLRSGCLVGQPARSSPFLPAATFSPRPTPARQSYLPRWPCAPARPVLLLDCAGRLRPFPAGVRSYGGAGAWPRPSLRPGCRQCHLLPFAWRSPVGGRAPCPALSRPCSWRWPVLLHSSCGQNSRQPGAGL